MTKTKQVELEELGRHWALASNNAHKAEEIAGLLAPLEIEISPQSAFGQIEVEETGGSFVENAILKARACCDLTGLPSLADDSGIEVAALRGLPGIHSARYAQSPLLPNPGDKDNCDKLLTELQHTSPDNRLARFCCVLVLMRHPSDPVPIIAHGFWRGRILEAPIGDGGFGYDPLFFDDELGRSAAQLSQNKKNQISHRAVAMHRLIELLTQH